MKTVFLWSRKSWTELCWISSGWLGEFARLRVWWWVHQIEQKCVIFLVLVFLCVFEFQFCMFQLNFCDMQYQVAIKYDRFSMVFAHTHYSFLFLLFLYGDEFFPTFFLFENSNYARMFASLFKLSHNVTQNWFGNFLPSPLLLHANKLNIPGYNIIQKLAERLYLREKRQLKSHQFWKNVLKSISFSSFFTFFLSFFLFLCTIYTTHRQEKRKLIN